MARSGNPAKRAAMERARAEARRALDSDGQSVTLPLFGKGSDVDEDGQLVPTEIEVPFILDWEDSALGFARAGLFRDWAEAALDDENFDAWCRTRPTVRTAGEFFDEWADSTGEDLGESPAS